MIMREVMKCLYLFMAGLVSTFVIIPTSLIVWFLVIGLIPRNIVSTLDSRLFMSVSLFIMFLPVLFVVYKLGKLTFKANQKTIYVSMILLIIVILMGFFAFPKFQI